MRTLQELAQEAIQVQDACNMSGVARGFVRAIDRLREIMPTLDTMGVCRHPVVKMWVSKIMDLAGMVLTDSNAFVDAYNWCKEHANDEEEVTID